MKTIYDLLTNKEKERVKHLKFKKDDILFREGDYCHEIGIVIKGVVSISSYSYQGIEMNYNTIVPGGIFGNNLIFSSDPIYRGNVISKLDTELVLINKETLIEILQNNKTFLLAYLEKQSDFGKTLNNKIKILSFHLAEDRLLYYLNSHNGRVKIRSVTSLAEELNLTREVLSRLLSKLEKENLIRRNGNEIVLN